MSLTRRILTLLRQEPGLSDREISQRLFGAEGNYQHVQIACRRLEFRGLVERDRGTAPIRNFPRQVRPLALVTLPELGDELPSA